MKSDGYSKYVCDKCGKTAYVAAGDTEAREWFTVRRYSAGKATRIARMMWHLTSTNCVPNAMRLSWRSCRRMTLRLKHS